MKFKIHFSLLLVFGLIAEAKAQVPTCVGTAGQVEWLVYQNISSTNLSKLYYAPSYPNSPDRVSFLSSLATPSQYNNDFGGLVRGFIIAPETGNYLFNVTGDDNSVFLLSTDTLRQNLVSRATIAGWTAESEFTKYTTQTSALISLVAGQYYYFEAIYKEGGGGDFIRIHWKIPSTIGGTTWQVIPSANIASQTCMPVCAAAGSSCDDGDPLTVNDRQDGNCHCMGTPNTLPSNCIGAQGSVKALYFDGITGNGIANLTGAAAYPLMPSRAEVLTTIVKPSGSFDNFGSRVRGYLRVPETGYYTFNITGNNQVRLLLGTADVPNATTDIIASINTFTNDTEHYKEAAQTSAPKLLTAGTFYSLELLHKDGTSSDGYAIYWRTAFKTDTVWRPLNAPYLYQYGCELACIPAGTPCNDGNANTFNDKYNASCACVGTPCADPTCSNALDYVPIEPCGPTDQQSNSPSEAWLSCTPAQSPNPIRGQSYWIQYDLGSPHALEGSQIWNYNAANATGQGFETVAVDYSTDGINWYQLGIYSWQEASGTGAYTGFQFSALNGIVARYLLVTALDNFANSNCFGLSEVSIQATNCPLVGQPCDDNNPLTTGDTYDYACQCNGISTAQNTCSIPTQTLAHIALNSGSYDAQTTIVSESLIEPAEKVRFIAGEKINLKSGFRAKSGSQFVAKIAVCAQDTTILPLARPTTDIAESEGLNNKTTTETTAKLRIYPNPTRNWTRIEYTVPTAGMVRLGVFNSTGQNVVWLIDGTAEAGEGYKEFPAHQLRAGLYHIVLRTEQGIVSEKLIVLE